MNSAEKKAIQQGLQFTGHCASDYGKNPNYPKQEAKKIRDLGYRAIIVRGKNVKCVFAEMKYFSDERIHKF